MEAALRIAEQHWRLRGTGRTEFISFRGGYHGDTAGAASLGADALFKNGPSGWNFPSRQIASIDSLEALTSVEAWKIAAVVIEPLIQGAAGMRVWPKGTLAAVRRWCDETGALLITDEVLTGFGRTGTMFAIEQERVIPDIMVLGKALTGGYLPLALTVTTEKVFKPFLDSPKPKSVLFYGHSYTGNALACTAALASLEVFRIESVLTTLAGKIDLLRTELNPLARLGAVRATRQCGFISAIELDAEVCGLKAGAAGAAVCQAARRHGLLTRPIRDVVVLMPPFCITPDQLQQAVTAIQQAIADVSAKAGAKG